MSGNSDAIRMLTLAARHGLDIVRVKHGGYAIRDANGQTIARVPSNGNGSPYWVKHALRAIRAAGDTPA